MKMNSIDFRREYLNEPIVKHDETACSAYKHFRADLEHRDKWMYKQVKDSKGRVVNGERTERRSLPPVLIAKYGEMYGVSVEQMKSHRECTQK